MLIEKIKKKLNVAINILIEKNSKFEKFYINIAKNMLIEKNSKFENFFKSCKEYVIKGK